MNSGSIGWMPELTSFPSIRTMGVSPSVVFTVWFDMSTVSIGISARALNGSPLSFAFSESLNTCPVAFVWGMLSPTTTTSSRFKTGV